MPYLVNTNNRTLLELIGKGIDSAIVDARNQKFLFFAVTCYLDINALKRLAYFVKEKTENNHAYLSGFYVFVDVGGWIKTKRSVESLTKDIKRMLSIDKIGLYPIHFSGQLFHAKSYCFVSSKNNDKRIGFVVATSGNLTMRGLGLKDQANNIEIYQRMTNSKALESFLDLARELKNTKLVTPDDLEKQDSFLLALRIFSNGSFYHKWEGNIGAEVRFKLNLTNKGEALIESGTQQFGQYSVSAKSISRDPLNLESIFKKKPKPFPKQFWGIYTIDTLFDRWAPKGIDSLIDRVLENSAQPYIEEIKRLTNKKRISKISKQLLQEAEDLKDRGYVSDVPEDSVALWVNRINSFRDNSDLISTKIFNYEKVPDILDASNRSAILKMLELVRKQSAMRSKLKGVKALLYNEIQSPNRKEFTESLKRLVENARKTINQHGGING